MITKDTAWMIRDIYRYAKHILQTQNTPSCCDGISIDGDYHNVFRLLTNKHLVDTYEIVIHVGSVNHAGFMEFADYRTTTRPDMVLCSYNDDWKNIQKISNPLKDLDFCADWEAACFQAECVCADMNETVLDALIIHSFIKDLSEETYRFILDTNALCTDGRLDEAKVKIVHSSFFD